MLAYLIKNFTINHNQTGGLTMNNSLVRNKTRKNSHNNLAGGISYHRSLKEQTLQVLMTGTFGDTFYASGNKLAKEAMEVFIECREKHPEFLAKAIVFARNKGFRKEVPILALAVLSAGGGRTKNLFERAFPLTVLIPDDLRSFVEHVKSGKIAGRKGLGGMTAKQVGNWLSNLSEYHALKYGSSNSRGFTLGDIARLAHPKPASASVSERLGWLIRGQKGLSENSELNPQLRALEALKVATTEEEQVELVRRGRLPFEVVLPTVSAATTPVWIELFHNAPYMNLLRNLVTFGRHGVFADEANVWEAVKRLTDHSAVERSKVLPYRFFTAWEQYCSSEGHNLRIADAIRQACELSFCNMPTLGNRKVAIGTDVSGSMSCQISEKSDSTYIDVAGIFTGALLKRCEDQVIPLPFDTDIHLDHGLSSRDDILVTAKKIASYCGGGTAVGAPIEHLLDRKIKVDVFIGITDNEDWAYGDSGYGRGCSANFLTLWLRYRKEVNPNAKAYLVTIAPYREAVAPAGEKGVRFIYGWSDQVLNFIGYDLEDGETQIQKIESTRWDEMSH
jgi:60 kDa SS-A/Ro ribonucleoprotein